MKNLKSIQIMANQFRDNFVEALEKGNVKAQKYYAKEILRLELVENEEYEKEQINKIKVNALKDVEFEIENEEIINQENLEKAFSKELKKIVHKYEGTSNTKVTQKQAETIRNGMRDRVGLDLNKAQIEFVNNLNQVQASNIIRLLAGISFKQQRLMISLACETIKSEKPEIYEKLYVEVKNNIYKKAWFDMNRELVKIADDLTPATDAQVRKIADLAKYPETRYTLLNDFDIDVDKFEERTDAGYFRFNFTNLKLEVAKKFNKQNAYNFIQTWGYISNFYEGNKLENEQMNHLRSLYTQLGDYDKTKLTYLSTITKSNYDKIALDLEEKVDRNKVANSLASKELMRELFQDVYGSGSTVYKSTIAKTKLTEEQQQAKDFVSFIHQLYSCIGQEVPVEMQEIIPYFVEGGEIKYAVIEENEYARFRKMVFEQREVIKEIDPQFNWGLFICKQPTHILVALGLDMML